MIWAFATIGLGIASIWLGLLSFDSYRQEIENDYRSAIRWEVISSALFDNSTSSTYGLKLILLGFVFLALGVIFIILKLIEIVL